MSLPLQAKLLRVLQDREFHRVGGTRLVSINIRIIAATNKNLRLAVKTGEFRENLFFRLNVISLTLPPLRERTDDLPALAKFFLNRHAKEAKRPGMMFSPAAMEAMGRYHWPGNIRELQNVIERSVVLSDGPELHVALPELDGKSAPVALHVRASNVTDISERARMLQVLKETKGMVGGANGAAARLGLKRTTLQSRMRKYNIGRSYQ